MSVSGILSSILLPNDFSKVQSRGQQFKQQFQQLGQDLQSGNLSAAQADFAALRPSSAQTTAASSSQSTSPIAQAFQQLSTDLQSGNVSAAQKDFAALQQDFQSDATQGGGHHHRHHHVDNDSQNSGSTISQVLAQLGQALQAGNLSTAQSAYTTLQQDFQQFAQNNGLHTQAPAAPTGISV
jgi:outer membrane protein assembly factor BamD (BamD/ComL family)